MSDNKKQSTSGSSGKTDSGNIKTGSASGVGKVESKSNSRRYDDRPLSGGGGGGNRGGRYDQYERSPNKPARFSDSRRGGRDDGFDNQRGVNKSRSETQNYQSDKGSSRKNNDVYVGKASSSKGTEPAKGDRSMPGDGFKDRDSRSKSGAGGDQKDKNSKKDSFTKDKCDKSTKDSGLKSIGNMKDVKSSQVKSAADLEAQWQKEEEEKQKKIKEEQKRQDEIKRKEEEEKKKEEEEEQKKKEQEMSTLKEFIQEAKEKIEFKLNLRELNQSKAENRPDDSFFSKLDSSLKKNTAFVKKLRNLTESQKDALTKDFESLNLSKYIGEAAAAITEAKLKMSDINCAIHLCSLLHQRYSDFSQILLEHWQKYLLNKKDEKIPNPSKYRVDLRFFADLVSVGVFSMKEGLPVLANQLALLVNNDKEEHNNLSIITSFCKHCGDDYVGLLPRKIRLLAEKYELEIPRSQLLPPERQKACRNLLGEYYQSLGKHLVKEHKDVQNIERQNRRILQTKGELSNERKESYEAALTVYQKLHTNTSAFSDLLDEDMPELPEDDIRKDEEAAFDIFNPFKNAEFQYVGDSSLFEDEDNRTFYENLPDLKSLIPGICYKDSENVADKNKEDVTELEEDLDNLELEDVEREMETEQQIAEVENKVEVKDSDQNKSEQEEEETDVDYGILPEGEEDESDTGSLMKMQFDAYIQSLPNCVNRDLIDKAAIEFCMNFNTKINRKKLVRALFTVHRTRYDLLPFYSRLVATLHPCMPDVANDLVQLLKGDFKWHVRKKDQINIESKLKTVRFIGELVKFKLYPKTEALHCLKMLMFDFSHHNIEMACALLDCCGRYLYRSQESHHRTKIYLDVMMRKKSALHLDSRYTTMIENAFYYSNPPEVQQVAKKIRPPMHEYIRKLLYKDLSKVTTEKVLRQMRKLDWDDTEIAFYATKSLIAVWNVRFNSIHCAANLLAGLAPYHEHVAIQVVDGVLEDIRLGMEMNHPKFNQRRVSCVKYLGELYNYRMVESAVIFKTLYSFITFAVSYDVNMPSPLDSPEHLFRIRLVCVLLETCGQYFDKGTSKKKLDCFLIYFQRYYWFKRSNAIWVEETRPFPIDIRNLVQDTLEAVRPKLKLSENFEEALKACEDLENEYKPRVASVLPIIETDEGNTSEADDNLTTIQEMEEEGDELSGDVSSQKLTGEEESEEDYSQSQRSNTGSQGNEGEGSDDNDDEDQNGEDDDDDDDNDEDGDDVMESAGEEEDEDQVLHLKNTLKVVKCAEDDDFMAAFDKMMVDNIQARNNENLKVPQLDIALPMHITDRNKKTATYVTDVEEPVEDNAIKFVLMTRKGNKQQFTKLNVPISAEFAATYKERERAEMAEKEKMKQVVLGIHERQEEEDYQEMIASMNRPVPVNTNRERRPRYQHPKGAPDADLIFGSKKR